MRGDLPCAGCGYNLRGLSVRAVCPECGTPVRATILATVDPYAAALRPVYVPWLTAAGILVWSGAGLAAALLTWFLRANDAAATLAGTALFAHPQHLDLVVSLATWCVFASAIGALALVRPHSGIPFWQSLVAFGGAGALAAAASLYSNLHGGFDLSHIKPYFSPEGMHPERIRMRLTMAALLCIAIFGLRPNARLLAARSLLLRMGMVDRQTMLAMAASIGLGALGDLIHLCGTALPDGVSRIASSLGDFMIAVGAMLFTLGLAGVFLDTLRIAPVLVRPPLAIARVLGTVSGAGTGR